MIAISVPDVMLPRDSGGYRWVVAIAAFFTQFIICGITYSIGVFHIVFSKIFNEDHFNTSWIGSILLYTTALTSKRILNFFKFAWAFSKDTVSKIQWFIRCDKNFQNDYAWMCMQNLQGLWNMFKHWVKRFYNPCTYNAIYHKIFSAKIILNAVENFWGFCQKKIIKLIKTCHSLYFDDFLIVAMFSCDIIGVVMRFFMVQFGCRWSVILGGLVSALGLSMGMVVTEMYQVYLTFGVLTGKISVSWSCQNLFIYHKHFYWGG